MPISGRCAAAGLALFTLVFTAGVAWAQTVTLKHSSDNLELRGKLVTFDGKIYVMDIDTFGRMNLPASEFRCEGAACPQGASQAPQTASTEGTGVLRITGADTIGARLMPALIRRYAASLKREVKETEAGADGLILELHDIAGKPPITIDLERQGSERAFASLAARHADIGMADRPITQQEIAMLSKVGYAEMHRPRHEHMIGLDGIVIITSLRNLVPSLSIEDLSKIFSGEVSDWSAFGLPPAKINLYLPDDKSGTMRTFAGLVLRPFNRSAAASAKRVKTNFELAEQVSADRYGIGLASFAELSMAKAVAIKDGCGLIHQPSEFSVKTGEYPLSRNLYLYTTSIDQPKVADLIRFASSEQGQATLTEIGFIDQSVVSLPYDRQWDRIATALNAAPEDFDMQLMRGLLDDLRGGQRLSATLRFEAGAAQLDSESVQNLLRLVHYLERYLEDGQQIILAGFADNSGAFKTNLTLSEARANSVRDALLAASNGSIRPDQIKVRGYSELVPVACNDTVAGRERNRRVEVWLPRQEQPAPARAKLLIERL